MKYQPLRRSDRKEERKRERERERERESETEQKQKDREKERPDKLNCKPVLIHPKVVGMNGRLHFTAAVTNWEGHAAQRWEGAIPTPSATSQCGRRFLVGAHAWFSWGRPTFKPVCFIQVGAFGIPPHQGISWSTVKGIEKGVCVIRFVGFRPSFCIRKARIPLGPHFFGGHPDANSCSGLILICKGVIWRVPFKG